MSLADADEPKNARGDQPAFGGDHRLSSFRRGFRGRRLTFDPAL